MRAIRPVLPYLAAGLFIAVGSVGLVLATTSSTEPAAARSTGGRAAPELSPSGRLAYWRQNPAGAFVLTAANLDGSSARPVHTLSPAASRPLATRWTGDGNGVAFAADAGLVVVRLDGTTTTLALPEATRASGFRVIDHRWSASGGKVAATVFRSTDARSDVYVGVLGRGQLARVEGLPNAFAGQWLNEDDLVVETATGVLTLVRDGRALRPLTEQRGASPIVDRDRVLFLAGPLTSSGDASGFFVIDPTLWSVGVDGTGARSERRLGFGGELRLDARWPDGRLLVHVVRDRSQWLAGDRLVQISSATTITRVIVSADGRSAIGFGGSRIYRVDLARRLTPDESTISVLLDGVFGGDVWVRALGR